MKKTIYFSLLVSLAVAYSSFHALSAQGINSFATFGLEINPSVSCSAFNLVTATGYAEFLNARARSDDQHFYHEEMGSDFDAGCIMRYGLPGNYSYEVIDGRENFPISYVTKNAAEEYFLWQQGRSSGETLATSVGDEDDARDVFIAANNGGLFIFSENNSLSIHSIVNNLTHPFLFGEIVDSGIITCLIGLIVWKTCGPCYYGNEKEVDPPWKPPLSTEKNEMVLANETIQLAQGEAPKAQTGWFQAGTKLCGEFAERMIKNITEDHVGIERFTTDLGRGRHEVEDEKGVQSLCTKGDSYSKQKGVKAFQNFVGANLENTIGGVMNQTLFVEADSLIREQRTKDGTEYYAPELQKAVPLGGIPIDANKSKTDLSYQLIKQESCNEAKSKSFVLKATYDQAGETIIPGISLKQKYLFIYTFTEKSDFSLTEPLSEKNFPCTVKCDDFQWRYEFLQTPGPKKK